MHKPKRKRRAKKKHKEPTEPQPMEIKMVDRDIRVEDIPIGVYHTHSLIHGMDDLPGVLEKRAVLSPDVLKAEEADEKLPRDKGPFELPRTSRVWIHNVMEYPSAYGPTVYKLEHPATLVFNRNIEELPGFETPDDFEMPAMPGVPKRRGDWEKGIAYTIKLVHGAYGRMLDYVVVNNEDIPRTREMLRSASLESVGVIASDVWQGFLDKVKGSAGQE